MVHFCAGRIAAISGDCKSPAFGHRRFESDPAHQIKKHPKVFFYLRPEKLLGSSFVLGSKPR